MYLWHYSNRYDGRWIPFEELEAAYNCLFEVSKVDDFEGVCLWNYNDKPFSFHNEFGCFNLENIDGRLVKLELERFLQGKSSNALPSIDKTYSYGVAALEMFERYIFKALSVSEVISLQPLNVLHDYIYVLNTLVEKAQLKSSCIQKRVGRLR